jgi:hypothetical protein
LAIDFGAEDATVHEDASAHEVGQAKLLELWGHLAYRVVISDHVLLQGFDGGYFYLPLNLPANGEPCSSLSSWSPKKTGKLSTRLGSAARNSFHRDAGFVDSCNTYVAKQLLVGYTSFALLSANFAPIGAALAIFSVIIEEIGTNKKRSPLRILILATTPRKSCPK